MPLRGRYAERSSALVCDSLEQDPDVVSATCQADMTEKGSSEAHTQLVRDIQLACSQGDTRLFINTNGLFYRENGIPIRVGLFVGCGDLIGWKSEFHGAQYISRTVMIEVKTGNAVPTKEQRDAIKMVNRMGGYAGVARSVEDARRVLGGEIK